MTPAHPARRLYLSRHSAIVAAMHLRPARPPRLPSRVFRFPSLRRAAAVVLALWGLAVFPSASRAGQWRVSPIRLDLGRDAKTGAITVVNEAEEKLQVQMSAHEWTQDAEGKDVYTESGDLVYFPRIAVIEGKEQRILRAGIRVPAAAREKAYRLFIEEIPGPRTSPGTGVAIAVRFGVPIFVKPVKEEPKAEIAEIAMDNGTVSARVRNAGNAHAVVHAVRVTAKNGRGEAVFTTEINGWYLLAGASRSYAAAIPNDVCAEVASVDVEVRTDKSTIAGRLDADRSMCPP